MSYAIITGASSGLGEKFATLFAKDHINILLIARREEKLKAIATDLTNKYKIKVEILPLDLSAYGAAQKAYDFTKNHNLEVEYLVNNAGFGLLGAFSDLNLQKQLSMLDLNIRALTELTGLFLPDMKKNGRGRILNIGSTAGFQPGPNMSVYYASKAYVNSFSEALSQELKGSGVTVTLSCPGATTTEFGDVAGARDARLFKMINMKASDVTLNAYSAMMAGQRRVIHGLHNNIAARTTGLLPNRLLLKIVSRLNSKVTR